MKYYKKTVSKICFGCPVKFMDFDLCPFCIQGAICPAKKKKRTYLCKKCKKPACLDCLEKICVRCYDD